MKINKPASAMLLAGMLFFSACIKDTNSGTEINGLQPMAVIPEGGLANFSKLALSFPATDPTDTVFFHANYAAPNVAPQDITVALSYDATALTAYNSGSSIQYEKFPDSIYSFKASSVTVKSGQNYSDAIPLTLYPGKIDPTHNYMFPISITSATGASVSGNFGTILYHLIGNPIAGAYTEEWIRYNSAAISGTPAFDLTFSNVFSADNPTQIEVTSQGTGVVYILSFTNTGGVLSNFQVSLDPASVANAGITITNGPTVVADPVNKKYIFNFTYNNSAGAARNITDIFHK